MNPFLTCSPLPHPSHRSPIRSPHRQSHCRPIWAIYAALKPSELEHQTIVTIAEQEPIVLEPPETFFRSAGPQHARKLGRWPLMFHCSFPPDRPPNLQEAADRE